MKRLLITLVGLVWVASVPLYASDLGNKNAITNISNVGFMENPSKELKEKFPMCDAFLKVKWIDKDSKVGYSEYETYNQGEKVKRVVHALVYLEDEHPEFEVNLDQFRKNLEINHKNGSLKAIFEIIRKGEFDRAGQGDGLVLKVDGNGEFFVYELSNILSDWDMPLLTLADHKMNICIPYPDNQRMYFAELKELNNLYDKKVIDHKRAELSQWIENVSFMERYTPIDVNSDGKEDYLAGTRTIYSHEGKYLEMKINKPSGSSKTKLISPTTGKTCEFENSWPGGDYFTTSGKNIFIDNQCNLTELTK